MTEQTEEVLGTKELFMQAIEEGQQEGAPVVDAEVDGAADEITLDHQPTDDDSPEYWEAFARSKGWKDGPDIDPADYKGYRSFVRDYDRIQDSKQSKHQASELKRQLDEVAKSTLEIQRQIQEENDRKYNALKQQLEKARAEAFDRGDKAAFEQADNDLKEVQARTEAKKENPPEAAQEAPVFVGFREANPEVKHDSEQFDPEVNALLESKVNQAIQSGAIQNEYQLTKFMENALTEVKANFVRYQQQPQRKPPQTNSASTGTRSKTLDPASLQPAERQYYDHYMKKGMKDVAEAFLKESLA